MRRLALVLPILTVLLPAWSAPLAAPAAGGSRSGATIQQFLKIRTPGAPAILPDGSLLLRDWPDGVRQLYRVMPKTRGTEAPSYRPGDATTLRLTDFPDGLAGFTLSPDGRKVILSHARGGNENTQLTLLDPLAEPGQGLTPLVSNPKVQASVNAWLRDGSGFIYSANDESPNDFYLYRYDFATGHTTRLLGEAGSWSVQDVTNDGSRALVQKYISASDAQCYELDLATGKLKELTLRPEGGTAACAIAGYMPGERAVLMLSDLQDGMQRLYLKDLGSGAVREPIPALGRFELDGAGPNDTREYLFSITNEDGYGVLSVFTLPDFKPVPMPGMDPGVVSVASFRGSTVVWTLGNARTAGLAYATTFTRARKGAPSQSTRQLTWTDDQGVDLKSFPLPELVKYTAFDGRQIPAFMCLPPGYTKGTAIPFVINYHGGPEGQHRPGFSATDQYLLSRGFGVLLPNVRGSTGYGRAYQMLDDYKGRWGSVRDGVDAADWLVKNGYATAGRIATYGGSYGGFMSVACLVEDQERVERGERPERLFGACVDIVGIVNLKTFLEKTSGYRRKLREMEYGPLTDAAFLTSISSIERVDKIHVPVFIAHGFNDPRVPVQEAMQLATALKERGQEPRMFVAPDEGHGFVKLDNRIYFNERMAQFLEEAIGSGRDAAK
jgi:dipeptidyl aminopeptidase/acylaminoacyl peptidase